MRKSIIVLLSVVLLIGTSYWAEWDRKCETIYSEFNGMKMFSHIHCTEDIKLSWIIIDEPILRDMSVRSINDFLISNNNAIINHLENSWSCDTISDVDIIKWFEDKIYSNNDISYSSTISSIESLVTSIENWIESFNSETLYSTAYSETKSKYSLWSVDFLRVAAKELYFEKLESIKNDVISNQKEKLTLLYKIEESQKFIESFYKRVDSICQGYVKTEEKDEYIEEKDEEAEEKLIEKYKDEFNIKLGNRLDAMSRPVLEQLSIKLISYANTSTVFKRFTEDQQKIVKLKIKGLKAAIDERL